MTNRSGNEAPFVASTLVREKIRTIDELAMITAQAKADGKRVVLAHGAFDLLHLGHVRHLEKARQLGDILIVTVTADKFINKGPGRPVFPHELRAEMLSALEFVSWTGIAHEPTAEVALETIKPSIYVKGGDYKELKDDPTGKISDEQDIVERNGGTFEIVEDVTFSSSGLINQHLIVRPPQVQDFLAKLKREERLDRILNLIDRTQNLKVVLVGETILDEYLYVSPLGKTAKDSIIATQYEDRELYAGGVIAAANHAANFCAEVEVVTVLGDDEYEDFVHSTLAPNVKLTVLTLSNRPTVRKRRYVESASRTQGMLRKVFEVAHIDDSPYSGQEYDSIQTAVRQAYKSADAVIVCDFGHGMIEGPVLQSVLDCDKFLAVNAQANSANLGFNLITKYNRADFVCIDEREAKLASGKKHADMAHVLEDELATAIKCQNFFITQGSRGCLCWSSSYGNLSVPAFEYDPIDTMGAGDAFLAVTSLLLALDGHPEDVGFIGNIVGGIKTRLIGHSASVNKADIKKSIASLLK